MQNTPTNSFPWKEIIGFLGVILAAYIGYLGALAQIEIPIQATQTAVSQIQTQAALSNTQAPIPSTPKNNTLLPTPTQSATPILPTNTITPSLTPIIPTQTLPPSKTPYPTHTPTQTTTKYTFEVQSNYGWQNSNVRVLKNDTVHVIYLAGQWRVADWDEYTDARGNSRFEGFDPSIPHGALIGKIENTNTILISNEKSLVTNQQGFLFFRINDADEFLFDNIGSITILIEITR